MFYKTQCEAVKIFQQNFSAGNFQLSVSDVRTFYDFRDSKEKMRLEFYSDLFDKYNYPVERIEFDVAMDLKCSERLADIVVFKDDKRKISYIAIDCMKDETSEGEFEIGVKNVIAKAEALGADFAVCVSRDYRRIIKLFRAKGVECQKIVRDLPIAYGAE